MKNPLFNIAADPATIPDPFSSTPSNEVQDELIVPTAKQPVLEEKVEEELQSFVQYY